MYFSSLLIVVSSAHTIGLSAEPVPCFKKTAVDIQFIREKQKKYFKFKCTIKCKFNSSSTNYRTGPLKSCPVTRNLQQGGYASTDTCTPVMYGNDTAAYWACQIQFAHQSNWFPSPIAGLFSYQIWNGYDGFWQNAVVLETFANFVGLTNNTHMRYKQVITGSKRSLYSLMEAYGPYPSFDDMAWYGLAFARIHEVMGDDEFLQDAEDIFNWIWKTGWDSSGTCGGGFFFDNNFNTKQTITNAQMLKLAARVARLTGKKDYQEKMVQTYKYILKNDLINGTSFLVSDGANPNCTAQDVYGPTYNSGVMIGGFVEMYKVTKDAHLLDVALNMAHATIQNETDSDGIFVEYCEPNCDEDALMFKGIFVRNVRSLIDITMDPFEVKNLTTWINKQVQNNLEKNVCDMVPITKCNITYQDGPPYYNKSGPVFSYDWRGPFKYGAPMQQTSVLDLFISAMLPGTRCMGDLCSYDPYFPPPQALTCGSHPCPTDQDCCEYSPYSSYTCCATGQVCNKTSGICE